MSTLRVNTLQNAAGTGQPAMSGAAKAWVNFNGTGTVAIRASFNVTSITDNGTGDYTVNFTNALEDANYVTVMVGILTGYVDAFAGNFASRTTTTNRLGVFYRNTGAGGAAWVADDPTEVSVAIFR
jgi:hypothetical protein